ncbi:Nuclear distribution protein nudE homolog 1 [Ustilago maydis 521] [Rhizoctonia solani]|uniref:Nuclear distribution protein nudE homolog 1 [Ustilago maydis 521] n=1 Tax=Rhizoctonia solani TaxID=456999 RepID=A0A0K6G2N2_9AGAM|nr:Nuclear distribution protein nudE homolog 1 [Ustilago maydis 521] [Rhizoctonia solani]
MSTAVLSPVTALHDRTTLSPPSTPSSSRPNDSVDWETKYHEVSDLLQETRAELDEFQTSSKELEEELERELETTERQMTDLRNRVERVERERDDCKSKLSNLQGTHNTTVNSLQRELDALRQQYSLMKVQLRELEVGNDDLERSERAVSSSLADLEARYARALEEKILLEHELQDRAALEEDMQRLKDELREANEESAIFREQNTRLSDQYTTMDEQNRSLSDEISRLKEELVQTQHLLEIAKTQPSFPSAPTTATSSAKSVSSHDSRPPTPSNASRASSDLHLEDLVVRSPSKANATPRAKLGVLASPSKRSVSAPRRPTTGIATPGALRTPNAQSALVSRNGLNSSTTHGTPDLLRRSTTAPTLASPVPTRLPTVRNSPALVAPRSRIPNGGPAASGLLPKRGTAVQMVGEMRARVRTLEQKINRVPLPRIRNPSARLRPADASKENETNPVKEKPEWRGRRSLDPAPQDSPGWVIVGDGPGKKGADRDCPSPSPAPRPPLAECASFSSQRSASTHRPSFSSDRSRRSTHEDPPPSAFRTVPESHNEIPASGRVTPASLTGSTRVVSRNRGSLSGRTTPTFGLNTTNIFGMSIRRPQSRNSSRNPFSTSVNGSYDGPSSIPMPLSAAPSLARIPASPLPARAGGGEDRNNFFARPTTPIGLKMLPVPVPVDRSPSKSENLNVRRTTRTLSMHPAGHAGRGTAANPHLPGLSNTRKVSSPPRRVPSSPQKMPSPPRGGANLGASRIGRPGSFGLSGRQAGKDEKKEGPPGRFRSGSVGWNRER